MSARYQDENQLSVRKGFQAAHIKDFRLTSEDINSFGRTVTLQTSLSSADSLLFEPFTFQNRMLSRKVSNVVVLLLLVTTEDGGGRRLCGSLKMMRRV